MSERTYITTTLPYVNADPHIGFALEVVQADAYARFSRLMGHEVLFNTGTDEHGQKIWKKAQEEGKDPQVYVNKAVKRFVVLKEKLNLSYTNFIRTSDQAHIVAAQEFWKRCDGNGDIYRKKYQVRYCVGCELEKTDSELEEGRCPLHSHLELELIDEENYFFRFSKYQDALLALYDDEHFVLPESRKNEVRSFVSQGLQDFSISRVKEKMPWGIAVPGDPGQVMYVWFDALVNYVSTIGWPERKNEFEQWWPVIQYAGKDNTRQQAAMWQAMLLSAGLPPSKQIVIHGFITSGGAKMSKSLGNVIDPIAIVDEYGTDALRYYLLREVSPFEDSDFTMEKFIESYNGNLANGLGNLASRIMKMAEMYGVQSTKSQGSSVDYQVPREYQSAMEAYRYNDAMQVIWELIGEADARIAETEPFKLMKTDTEAAKKIIAELVQSLAEIAYLLSPFMPTTAEILQNAIKEDRSLSPLFVRR